MTAVPARLRIDRSYLDDAVLVVPHGVLDLSSYAELRDTLIKCAVELPRAVLVDVSWLRVPTTATLAVFSSVWLQVSDWPGVPIVLIAGQELIRRRLARGGIPRYLRVHRCVEDALGALAEPPPRRRTILELPRLPDSVAAARRFVQVTCDRWECPEIYDDAVLVASELVENVIRHGKGDPRLRLELAPRSLTVAVYDDDLTPARLVEPGPTATAHRGLMLVARLSTTWSCAPTLSGGKVVWAVLRLP
jgi:anti-sigma regulatory factor (Ser/Thr protein kinase)